MASDEFLTIKKEAEADKNGGEKAVLRGVRDGLIY